MYNGVGVYSHYKGKHYAVLGLARHNETGEHLVVYIPLYENYDRQTMYTVHSLDHFNSTVSVDGITQPRFTKRQS